MSLNNHAWIEQTFVCNNAEFKVTNCGKFVAVVYDYEADEPTWHVNPIEAWLPEIQELAKEHHKVMTNFKKSFLK